MAVRNAENGVVRGHSRSTAMSPFDRAYTTSYLTLIETRVPALSCGVVCVILRLAVLVEHRLVTDGRTDTGPWLVPRMHSIAR